MTSEYLDRVLRECAELENVDVDVELTALRTAILIEETFDVVLTDEQLTFDFLGNLVAVREFLLQNTRHR